MTGDREINLGGTSHGGGASEALSGGSSGQREAATVTELEKRELRPPFSRTEQGWLALPADVPIRGDSMEDPDRSSLWVLEDEGPLGPPHAQHFDIAQRGAGRYSHWGDALWFSTPDGSDPNTNGRNYAVAWERPQAGASAGAAGRSHPVLDMLADVLRARDVRRVTYFHTDHFEPLHAGRPASEWMDSLRAFARLTAGSRFAARLSLFYSPLLVPRLVIGTPSGPDRIDFDYPTDDRHRNHLALCREFIRPLEAELGHEFHLHMHHEGWTASNHTFPFLTDFVERGRSRCCDSRSLDTYLAACLPALEGELGRRFSSWAFVHGNWALNGSDPLFCAIEDELAILKRHGCFGDFTFPAGNGHNDPALKVPYTCATPTLPRAYDREEASPRPLSRRGADLGRDRILIWNSRLDAARSSLDLYSPGLLALLKQPQFLLRDWFADAPVVDGCLYIKTHAHSADGFYRLWTEDGQIPHTYGPVQDLFTLLERALDRAGIPLRLATVNEVMAELTAFDRSTSDAPEPAQHVA